MNDGFELAEVEKLLFQGGQFRPDELPLNEVENCYRFLEDFCSDKIIYGINTGFGPMAQWRVADRHLTALQYNIIRSHATGAGEPLPDLYLSIAGYSLSFPSMEVWAQAATLCSWPTSH